MIPFTGYKDIKIYIIPNDYIPKTHLKFVYEEAINNVNSYNKFLQHPITFKLEYFLKLNKVSDPGDHVILHKSFDGNAINLKRQSIFLFREAIPHSILRTIELRPDFFMWRDSDKGIDFVKKWKIW